LGIVDWDYRVPIESADWPIVGHNQQSAIQSTTCNPNQQAIDLHPQTAITESALATRQSSIDQRQE
jgi:hypothetical protein